MSYSLKDRVAVASFDDGKANAIGHAFIEEMHDALDRSLASASAIVISGRDGMFSGGFDLQELRKSPEAATALVNKGAQMLLRIFSHPQPVVAAATGHAIAAGAFILLASDTRFAAEGEYKIGLNETAIGMTLPVFGLELAHARLSKRHLTQAVTQATIYPTAAARDVGFLDHIVPADALLEAATREAARLGEMDTNTYHQNKIRLRQAHIDTIERSLS